MSPLFTHTKDGPVLLLVGVSRRLRPPLFPPGGGVRLLVVAAAGRRPLFPVFPVFAVLGCAGVRLLVVAAGRLLVVAAGGRPLFPDFAVLGTVSSVVVEGGLLGASSWLSTGGGTVSSMVVEGGLRRASSCPSTVSMLVVAAGRLTVSMPCGMAGSRLSVTEHFLVAGGGGGGAGGFSGGGTRRRRPLLRGGGAGAATGLLLCVGNTWVPRWSHSALKGSGAVRNSSSWPSEIAAALLVSSCAVLRARALASSTSAGLAGPQRDCAQ